MASRLQWRLGRLERSTVGVARACATCGHPTGGGRPPSGYKIQVYGGGEEGPRYEGPERCPDCGAQLVINIAFDKGG